MDHEGVFFYFLANVNCRISRASGGFTPWTSGITFTNNRLREKHINLMGKLREKWVEIIKNSGKTQEK